jgi:hypothetical protein
LSKDGSICKEALVMGDYRVDGPQAPCVQSPEEMAVRFQSELITALPGWKEQLAADPDRLIELEREIHAAFSRGADLVVVGLMAAVTNTPRFEATREHARQAAAVPLSRGRLRQVQVRLLGGLIMWVTSLYCTPRKSWLNQTKEKARGMYVELAQFGFGKGCTPGLQSLVARQAALCPSLQFAQQELERSGVKLDVKTVRRLANQCGEDFLHLRTQELLLWREGKLPAGTELAGKRVSVQIDGGRTRIRGKMRDATPIPEVTNADGLPCDDAPGRSRKRPRKTFDADWREPKLVTIFVHDDEGRMAKKSKALVDGTLLGPDAVAELVAMHLHRLGAAKALSVTFVADGGIWIWERIRKIVELAKLPKVPLYEVLDNCHASHHISLALAALGLGENDRRPIYREYRTRLRNGHWQQVVDELKEMAAGQSDKSQVWTEIAYLQKHGEAGRLKYPTFRSLGLPLGSGAIESNIRRVVNLRLKGNAIYWLAQNAEAMLQIRSYVLTDRWDQRLSELRKLRRLDVQTAWHWTPRDMRSNVERATTTPA